MAIERVSTSNKENNNVALPAGEYDGKLVYVADLGLIRDEYKGEVTERQKIVLGIEILGKEVELDVDGEKVTKPLVLWSKAFNIYAKTSSKSIEFKFATVFDPSFKGGVAFDWEEVLGSPVSVALTVTDDGKFNNVASLMPIPARFAASLDEAVSDPYAGRYDEEPIKSNIYGLPLWLVKNRGELAEQPKEVAPKTGEVAPAAEAAQAAVEASPVDDLPF